VTRRAPRGFTLLEVLVALVVTSVVVSLAFGAASAGLDVRERLDRFGRDEGGAAALRDVLHDALRHAERGGDDADTTFVLVGDELKIVTRGVRPPLGTGGRWAVSLRAEPEGLVLRAAPTPGTAGAPFRIVAPAVASVDVRALAGVDGAWIDAWDRPSSPPAAVSVRFLDARGGDAVPALLARTRPAGLAEDAP
jgi:prepilin-type N-terminal cleavage/methylation domain-containing protein